MPYSIQTAYGSYYISCVVSRRPKWTPKVGHLEYSLLFRGHRICLLDIVGLNFACCFVLSIKTVEFSAEPHLPFSDQD